jgi:hypothetical protein
VAGDNVNIFSFKFKQQSNGCATHTDCCKHALQFNHL